MSVWQRDPFNLPRRFALGLWMPRRKLASRAYVPAATDRRQLAGKRPFWQCFGEVTIAGNQMSEQRVKLQSDFIAYTSMISTTVGGSSSNPGVRVQIFDSSPMPGKGKRFSIVGVNDTNLAGSAKDPYVWRRPYRFYAGHTIIVRILNLQSVSNKAQLVIHGVQDE